jgi:uncharacterized membrane protein
MTWRGSVGASDRIFSILIYLFALYDAWSFGGFLVREFPILGYLAIPLLPIEYLYGIFGQFFGILGGFLIFILLFVAVARNANLAHFLRFNAMQTILIGILLSLLQIATRYLLQPLFGNTIIIEVFFNVVFLGAVSACIYCMIQSALGRYPEIPVISEATYSQIF